MQLKYVKINKYISHITHLLEYIIISRKENTNDKKQNFKIYDNFSRSANDCICCTYRQFL